MKGALGSIMKQAQKMQEDFQRAQEELAAMQVTGESGGGLVKVTMTGRRDVLSVSIDPILMQEDVTMVEDLVAASVNDATRKIDAQSKDKLSAMTAGLNLPPGFNLPF